MHLVALDKEVGTLASVITVREPVGVAFDENCFACFISFPHHDCSMVGWDLVWTVDQGDELTCLPCLQIFVVGNDAGGQCYVCLAVFYQLLDVPFAR